MDTRKQIESWFPNIIGKKFTYFEPENKFEFNCLAFSLNMNVWIWTNENWPKDIPSNLGAISFKLLFEKENYKISNLSDHEIGYEKIAIYVKNSNPTHVAKQNSNIWQSKVGNFIIEHELEWLCGETTDAYGEVILIMKRKINS